MIDAEKHMAAVWVTPTEMELLLEALMAIRPQALGERAAEIDALTKQLEEAEFGPRRARTRIDPGKSECPTPG